MEEKVYWIWLQRALGFGNYKIDKILSAIDIKTFYELGPNYWKSLSMFTEREIKNLGLLSLDYALNVCDKCINFNYKMVTYSCKDFPMLLRKIPNPPCLLYIKGDVSVLSRFCISVVGSRDASIYGTQMAFDISYDLAKFGITIVSGGAVGIDSASHRGAIASNGKTVAVMACGIDYPYLLQNSKLREEVSNFGALVSEYPPGHPVQKFNFYTRNRIISGISSGTVVIEAAKRSGAILTANLAVEHNRDVFVVPVNQSSPLSEGPTELISDGARVITCALDVLEEYKHFKIKDISYNRISKNNKSQDNKKNNEKAIKNLSQQSILVFKSLKKEKIHIDELKKITGLPIQKLSSILTNLELLSLITSLPGKFYIKSIESDS